MPVTKEEFKKKRFDNLVEAAQDFTADPADFFNLDALQNALELYWSANLDYDEVAKLKESP